MEPIKLTIKITLGEFCFDIKFNEEIERLFSKLESENKDFNFDKCISPKNEIIVQTNTKYFKIYLSNDFNNLINSFEDDEIRRYIIRNISIKYKLKNSKPDFFRTSEFSGWNNFVNEINKIDANYY